MKIEKSQVERWTISDKSLWADFTLSSDGFLNIQSDYGCYSYRWNSFGSDIKKFLIACDKCYLYSKLSSDLGREFNLAKSIKLIRKDIIEQRRVYQNYNAESCREFWDATKLIEKIGVIFSAEGWYREIESSCLYRMYEEDVSSIPCETSDNYQLTQFLDKIWPVFIEELKNC